MSSNITIKQIIAHWQENAILEKHIQDKLDPEKHCWHCHTAAQLSVHYIVPKALGGKMQADNFVLLCSQCAAAAPLSKDKAFFLEWLLMHSHYSFHNYSLISAVKLFQEIYSTDLGDIMHELDIDPNHISDYLDDEKKWLCQQLQIKSINIATTAGFFRSYINKQLGL
jgi:HNH endonuclease